MVSFLVPLIFSLILVIVIGLLFWRLKNTSWYNFAIYFLLLVFWIVLSVLTKKSRNNLQLSWWVWPLITSSFHFLQAIIRLPIGKWSSKIKSRKIPLLLTASIMIVPLMLMIIFNYAFFTIILGSLVGALFASTFGLQNQYWSENYDIRSVFLTVAMITILPSLGSLIATTFQNLLIVFNLEFATYLLIALLLIFIIALVIYYFIPEKRETIKIDNKKSFHQFLSALKLKNILQLSMPVAFVSLSYNLVSSGGTHQDAITDQSDFITIILTIVAILVALTIALFLIRIFSTYILEISGLLILILGLLIGFFYNALQINSYPLYLSYLIVMTIGFSIYQNALFSTILHIDHKNSLLVLGIWLTIRSIATGWGQFFNQIISQIEIENLWWLFAICLTFAFIALSYSLWLYLKNNYQIYQVVDFYEKKHLKERWL